MPNDKRTEIADFLYEAMCVDGFVKFDCFTKDKNSHGLEIEGMLFEITDKKRGLFYISWMVPLKK